jgi:hypothetical protein
MKKQPKVKVMEITVKRRVQLEEKVCPQCGKKFMGRKLAQYCSKACVRKASYWRDPERYRQYRRESYRRQKREGDK